MGLPMSSETTEAILGEAMAPEAPVAIRVTGLSKCYQVYKRPEDRLKQSVMPRLHRLLGRPTVPYYQEFWALRDVSMDIRKGETIGIIGRNGSGKSTLLQMICGTLTPTSGEVEVNGRVAALLELGAGFNPEFTGRENVYLNGAVLGLSKEQIDRRFDDIAAFADIGGFMDQSVKTYSSGMYVRLAFAVMAHVDADILVIDEALAVGDVFFGQKCMRFLRKFKENGTIVFVSHDSSAVVNLCERAYWLEGGRLGMSGDAKTVCEAYHAKLYSKEVRPAGKPSTTAGIREAPAADFRAERVDASTLRNDIEVFSFDPDKSGFGSGAAKIRAVHLTDADGQARSWVIGGELVQLKVQIDVHRGLDRPIVGFFVKDRLGQRLFGDNTYLNYQQSPVAAAPGEVLEAVFEFVMPILPKGHYSFDIAIADGTVQQHDQADWIHDGLVLESHSSSVSTGLMGIPFRDIRLAVSGR